MKVLSYISTIGLTTTQAQELANLFAPLLDANLKTMTKTTSLTPKRTIDYVDVYVADGAQGKNLIIPENIAKDVYKFVSL